MPRITVVNCVLVLFWISIFLDNTYAQNAVLECTIRDGQDEIHLQFRRTEQLLANGNLPVWAANPRKRKYCQNADTAHQLIPNLVKDKIGDFILYHDVEKSSAVTLFRRTNTLVGVIDTRYVIVGLPLDECNSVIDVGSEFVERMNCESMTHEDHIKGLDLSMPRATESVTESDGTPPPVQDDSITTLYPEIMVFLPYDLTKLVKGKHPNNYIEILVAQQIMYFNAIDMLLSKLSTVDIKIHLNLAGIVIEVQENAFNFLPPYHKNGVQYVDADRALNYFKLYGQLNHYVFPQDSFDFFFIPTSQQLWWTPIDAAVDGLAAPSGSYNERRDGRYIRFWPGVVARHSCGFEYVTASHEIAHLLSIEHDPWHRGHYSMYVQCYAIMQEIDRYCPDCLKWSDKSIQNFRQFARDDRDHCYLLNRPRSLHPYGSRIQTLSPSEQCRCFGFEPWGNGNPDVIYRGGCGRSLMCGRGSEGMLLPPPIDGTPCANNGICWEQVCRGIQVIP